MSYEMDSFSKKDLKGNLIMLWIVFFINGNKIEILIKNGDF